MDAENRWVCILCILCTAIVQVARSLRTISPQNKTAEYTEYAEKRFPQGLLSAYFAYSAVSFVVPSVAAWPRWDKRALPSC
jgi:hypothetical protein